MKPVSDSVQVVQRRRGRQQRERGGRSMVGMIEVQRQFEIQMKLQTAESNEQRANQILIDSRAEPGRNDEGRSVWMSTRAGCHQDRSMKDMD